MSEIVFYEEPASEPRIATRDEKSADVRSKSGAVRFGQQVRPEYWRSTDDANHGRWIRWMVDWGVLDTPTINPPNMWQKTVPPLVLWEDWLGRPRRCRENVVRTGAPQQIAANLAEWPPLSRVMIIPKWPRSGDEGTGAMS